MSGRSESGANREATSRLATILDDDTDESHRMPGHVLKAWRRWNLAIDAALDAELKPWALAETAAAAIAGEWRV